MEHIAQNFHISDYLIGQTFFEFCILTSCLAFELIELSSHPLKDFWLSNKTIECSLCGTLRGLGTGSQEINYLIDNVIVGENFWSCKHLRNEITSIGKITADLSALSFLNVVCDDRPKPRAILISSSLSFSECNALSSQLEDQSPQWIVDSCRCACLSLKSTSFNCIINANLL